MEVIANSCKIIRICLRDETVYDAMAVKFPILATLLVDKMAKFNQSQPIVSESTSALRNYVRKPDYVRLMRPDCVDILVDVARDPKNEKYRVPIGQTLKMMQKVPEMDQRIKLKSALDLL
jgi:hypothetical protein